MTFTDFVDRVLNRLKCVEDRMSGLKSKTGVICKCWGCCLNGKKKFRAACHKISFTQNAWHPSIMAPEDRIFHDRQHSKNSAAFWSRRSYIKSVPRLKPFP